MVNQEVNKSKKSHDYLSTKYSLLYCISDKIIFVSSPWGDVFIYKS